MPEPQHLEEESEAVQNLEARAQLIARLNDIEAHNVEEIRNLEVHSPVNLAFTFGEEQPRRLVCSLDMYDLHVLLRCGSLEVTDPIIRVTLWYMIRYTKLCSVKD